MEDFVNKYKSSIQFINNVLDRFKVVNGEDIRKYYLHTNYKNSEGTLGSSCMRHDETQGYLDIYTNNPDKVSLVILMFNDTNKIMGRALLWTDSRGRKIMDRIYLNNTPDEEIFKEYAIRNGYLYKSIQSYSDDTLMFNGNKVSNEDNKVTIKVDPGYDSFPYVDTFKYYNHLTGKMSNKMFPGADYELTRTDGTYKKIN